MTEDRYKEACALLPEALRRVALGVDPPRQARTEELRLRVGRPLALTLPEGEVSLPGPAVDSSDLTQVLDKATAFSRYAAGETISQGFVTAEGGFRIGLCGTAIPEGGENRGLRDITSAAIRIPHACPGVAEPLLPELLERGRVRSTLILSPPGGGKTTLLRDLVRLLSQGGALAGPMRVALVDERGELAAVCRGKPQLNVGPSTDILDGCPKAAAVPMLLRAMNPQVIALDEIALPADVGAVLSAAGCGAAILATAHGASVAELRRRTVLRELLESGVFRRAVVIEGRGTERCCRVEELP